MAKPALFILVLLLCACGDHEDSPEADADALLLESVAPVAPVVGTWYLHRGGVYRQYTFYEGYTYEAWEGTPADMKHTSGTFTLQDGYTADDPYILTLNADREADRVRVGARVSGDTLAISPAEALYEVKYLALDEPYINPPRIVGTWQLKDKRLTLRPDFTYSLEKNDPLPLGPLSPRRRRRREAPREERGTYLYISDPQSPRLILRQKESGGRTTVRNLELRSVEF